MQAGNNINYFVHISIIYELQSVLKDKIDNNIYRLCFLKFNLEPSMLMK